MSARENAEIPGINASKHRGMIHSYDASGRYYGQRPIISDESCSSSESPRPLLLNRPVVIVLHYAMARRVVARVVHGPGARGCDYRDLHEALGIPCNGNIGLQRWSLGKMGWKHGNGMLLGCDGMD